MARPILIHFAPFAIFFALSGTSQGGMILSYGVTGDDELTVGDTIEIWAEFSPTPSLVGLYFFDLQFTEGLFAWEPPGVSNRAESGLQYEFAADSIQVSYVDLLPNFSSPFTLHLTGKALIPGEGSVGLQPLAFEFMPTSLSTPAPYWRSFSIVEADEPPVHSNPEPGSAVLAVVGLSCLGLARGRFGKKRAAG